VLTKLTIRRFKRFDEAVVELGNPVVLVGPNNSGKTTALQALALWDAGVKKWIEKRSGKTAPAKRPGVTINRRDLIAIPVPNAGLLWRELRVRSVKRKQSGQTEKTQNVLIEIEVEGVTEGRAWKCGLEFDYANEESFYCRPIRTDGVLTQVPDEAGKVRIAYLQPMSGLATAEDRLSVGTINVRIGEGRTADVLRNLCYRVVHPEDCGAETGEDAGGGQRWKMLVKKVKDLFGVELEEPRFVEERGQITMGFREATQGRPDVVLDLSSAGRGLQQTLLLLAYMYAHPGAVLLLDEPDAHLEILRQRQTYQLLRDVAASQGNQVIIATHSGVLLNEAADRDQVVAFVGRPHVLVGSGSQVQKALTNIGYDQYYLAEQKGWVLYLEGSTDLSILQAFAAKLGHRAAKHLERPLVKYVGNEWKAAWEHFWGLREAWPKLLGVAIYDRQDSPPEEKSGLTQLVWSRREIENYLCYPEVLREYARSGQPHDLFGAVEAEHRESVMKERIDRLVIKAALENPDDPWWRDVKASTDFLDRLFREYFSALGLPHLMSKGDYYRLAQLMPVRLVNAEIGQKLDAVLRVADAAERSGG
jgi:ABC-type taurine transport system ATPase subunit